MTAALASPPARCYSQRMATPKPSTPYGSRRTMKRIVAHVTPPEQAAVKSIAKAWGLSVAETIRRMVMSGIDGAKALARVEASARAEEDAAWKRRRRGEK